MNKLQKKTSMKTILSVRNLRTYYKSRNGWIRAVDDISFDLNRGETLGIAGESGSGKSTIALSILRVLPSNGRIFDGQIQFKGKDLLKIREDEMNNVRWKEISIIFQGSLNALNPVYNVGNQLINAILTKENISKEEAKNRAKTLFELVGIPPSRMDNYPHQFSGGMKQRVMIALSLICNPDLLIADEPTTALDVVVQDQILREIEDLQKKFNISMIMITHDLSIIAETCDKIAIIYGGKIFEYADSVSIFKNPCNPYTMLLINSFPSVRGPLKRLKSVQRNPPNSFTTLTTCPFGSRCSHAKEICRKKEPPFTKVRNGHYSYCHLALELAR